MAAEYEVPYMMITVAEHSIYWKRQYYKRVERYGIDWLKLERDGYVEITDEDEKRTLELNFQRNSERM